MRGLKSGDIQVVNGELAAWSMVGGGKEDGTRLEEANGTIRSGRGK